MSATAVIEPDPVPLVRDRVGRLMVAGTRIPLERIIIAHQDGESPEDIHYSFDTVPLAEVYAVISYYLHHRDEIDAYLAEREKQIEEFRATDEARFPSDDLPAKLLARRQAWGSAPDG